MPLAVYDAALNLRSVTAAATTATTSTTGIAVPIRFMQPIAWVIQVTALDAAGADETYSFTLEVSDLVGGTYAVIATLNWPRARSTGVVYVPVAGQVAVFASPSSAFVRATVTQAGVTSSINWGSYLTKAAPGNMGAAVGPGSTAIWT